MKNFDVVYHTDIGIKKQTNEDSILINGIASKEDEILMAVICDGMGGMVKGELASATVVNAFDKWLKEQYINFDEKWNLKQIKDGWTGMIVDCNNKLISYGKKQGIQLGTTMTVMLLNSQGKYIIGHIGDTRVYLLSEKISQLTEDHTFIAREIKLGKMTKKQALNDTRRNVLLQCVGVNRAFDIQFIEGEIKSNEAVLLCSDGFRHQVMEEEILTHLRPDKFSDVIQEKQEIVTLVEMNKERQETDNISAIYIKKL